MSKTGLSRLMYKVDRSVSPFAPVPFEPLQDSLFRAIQSYGCMVRILLVEYRASWFYNIFASMLLPLGLIFFITRLGGVISSERAIFLLGGNMASSIAYGPTSMLITRIGWGRHTREFDYWATLPVSKLGFLLALVLVYLLFALPGLVSSYLVGSWVFGFPHTNLLVLAALVPLGAVSLSGFGAMVGTLAHDGPTSNIYANALIGFITFLSPIMIPREALPAPLRFVAMFVPTTYVAEAFREGLAGSSDIHLVLNVLAIAFFSAVFLALVYWKLDWRSA